MRISTMPERTYEEVKAKLAQYDIITFDVFDTLITRCVRKPEDVFAIVEARGKMSGIIQGDFARDRYEAEQQAWKLCGDGVDFEKIYEFLRNNFGYGEAQCASLMALELDTERRVVVPRKAVRSLLYQLREMGKHILLCSDMYLSSQQIRDLLAHCGYPEDMEIWVSSEQEATKHSGKLWDLLFAALPDGETSIHVGDNEHGDCYQVCQRGREALLLDSGLSLFEKSELHGYLSKYENENLGSSLVLGYLINNACFNSPFQDCLNEQEIVAVWGGAVFACFMEFLDRKRDDTQLLFLTREGFLLKNLYECYCRGLGVKPQCGGLFYASRTATSGASVTSEEDILESMLGAKFHGPVEYFLENRLNYILPINSALFGLEISLPEQRRELFEKLHPYISEIIHNGMEQKLAYRRYIASVRKDEKRLTVVDVGYNGTIQYNLSKILGEKVGGRYLFLNDGAWPKKNGCLCEALANPRDGQHPLYDNLLFLEAVMQVPYGQLRRMEINQGEVRAVFNADANFSEEITAAQQAFAMFVENIATWKKIIGDKLKLDFSLAEAIWVCLLRFDILPRSLLNALWLADGFGGVSMWKYQPDQQQWTSSNDTVMPLSFTLLKNGKKLSVKKRFKNFIKKHIPYFLYEHARKIWQKFSA